MLLMNLRFDRAMDRSLIRVSRSTVFEHVAIDFACVANVHCLILVARWFELITSLFCGDVHN